MKRFRKEMKELGIRKVLNSFFFAKFISKKLFFYDENRIVLLTVILIYGILIFS